jgi:ADP-heptose:LPS heptosyltransferase
MPRRGDDPSLFDHDMNISRVLQRIGHIARWRYIHLAYPLADRLAVRWGRPARLIRWPVAAWAPLRRRRLDVARGHALGDVLMCTPALRELKRLNPACHVTFYTEHRELAASFPFIDRVRPTDEAPPDAVWMLYEHSLPPRRHLARILGDSLGIDVRDVRPWVAADEAEVERFRAAWKDLPGPRVLVVRQPGDFTRNKDWPDEYWEALIDRLLERGTVIDAGVTGPGRRPRSHPHYVDLVGRTTLPQFIAAMAAVDLHVAPDTGTIHVAAALGIPSVVIYGGYLNPESTAYPGNIGLYSPVECAPCWLRSPCPYGRKCLHQITPDQVEAAVDRLWRGESAPRPAAGDATAGREPQTAGAVKIVDMRSL